ncbi:MAG: DUF1246 domain-containing protein [Candidatus Thermoplasmatota archaeon]
MIEKNKIEEILEEYDEKNISISAIASHSALDVFDGAKEENFRTIAVCQKGREKTYAIYFKRRKVWSEEIGFIDEVINLEKFSNIIKEDNQKKLRNENAIFIPNRSFTSYCKIDEIEKKKLKEKYEKKLEKIRLKIKKLEDKLKS